MLRKTFPYVVSVLLSLLGLELLGAAVFFWQNHSLVYTNDVHIQQRVVEERYKQRLHPFFGYTGTYSLNGPAVYTNNLGFPQRQNRIVPFKPEPNDFVVVVFGASIAANLVAPPQNGMPIQEALQERPEMKDRHVVVYSMSQGPQKQPQQLMELAFLLALGQHIDLVIDVGGTVEFTSGLSNYESGIHPIFPPAATLGAIGRELSPVTSNNAEFYEMAYYLSHDRQEVERYTTLVRESTSGLAYLKNKFAQAYYARRLAGGLTSYERVITRSGDWEDTKKLLSLDMAVPIKKTDVMEDIFETWLRCSDLMRLMANANGVAFAEVIHPNPYHSKKRMTEAEQKVLSIPENDYFRRGSVAGYGLLERHADLLESRHIVSGASLFDDVPDTIYIDSTGHLSQLGETLLARFVADQAAKVLTNSPSSRASAGGSH